MCSTEFTRAPRGREDSTIIRISKIRHGLIRVPISTTPIVEHLSILTVTAPVPTVLRDSRRVVLNRSLSISPQQELVLVSCASATT